MSKISAGGLRTALAAILLALYRLWRKPSSTLFALLGNHGRRYDSKTLVEESGPTKRGSRARFRTAAPQNEGRRMRRISGVSHAISGSGVALEAKGGASLTGGSGRKERAGGPESSHGWCLALKRLTLARGEGLEPRTKANRRHKRGKNPHVGWSLVLPHRYIFDEPEFESLVYGGCNYVLVIICVAHVAGAELKLVEFGCLPEQAEYGFLTHGPRFPVPQYHAAARDNSAAVHSRIYGS
ncbi:hypothetical protein C8J57DRAFT_1234014 [Mycena rebaudengoi]|nr:hypothetical protein C8J57DRAFT_1234014 [Mycena rebaudengoi]